MFLFISKLTEIAPVHGPHMGLEGCGNGRKSTVSGPLVMQGKLRATIKWMKFFSVLEEWRGQGEEERAGTAVGTRCPGICLRNRMFNIHT